MTIFGGQDGNNLGILNDVWVLSNANGLGGTIESIAEQPAPEKPSRSEDGRYEVSWINGQKVITDTKTGLMWTPDIGKKGLNKSQIEPAVEELNRDKYAGYSDWRLPTREELRSIHENNKRHRALDYPNSDWTIGIDPVFDLTGYWLWSGELRNPSSLYGLDYYNNRETGYLDDIYNRGRILAVRFANKPESPESIIPPIEPKRVKTLAEAVRVYKPKNVTLLEALRNFDKYKGTNIKWIGTIIETKEDSCMVKIPDQGSFILFGVDTKKVTLSKNQTITVVGQITDKETSKTKAGIEKTNLVVKAFYAE